MNWATSIEQIQSGDRKLLARLISVIENEHDGYEDLLKILHYALIMLHVHDLETKHEDK